MVPALAVVGAARPLLLAWGGVSSLAARHPLAFGSAVTGIKTAAADVLSQRVFEERPWVDVDVRRIFIFLAFGVLYLGMVQYAIHVVAFSRIFPTAGAFVAQPLSQKLRDRSGQRAVLGQVLLDQGLHWPLVALPAFYVVKGIGEGNLRESLSRCVANWPQDVLDCWKWWLPAMTFNFSFCPMEMRVPFNALVSFAYMAALSFRRGGAEQPSH